MVRSVGFPLPSEALLLSLQSLPEASLSPTNIDIISGMCAFFTNRTKKKIRTNHQSSKSKEEINYFSDSISHSCHTFLHGRNKIPEHSDNVHY